MKPFIDCKYESIYNVLKNFNKDAETLDYLYYFKLKKTEKDLLKVNVESKVNFFDFLKTFNIEEESYSKTFNLKRFLDENLKNGNCIVIKVDLFYQDFSNKYYMKKHKKHNVFIRQIIDDNVWIIENEFADSENYIEMCIKFKNLEMWYNGYLENYFFNGKDIEDTLFVYKENKNSYLKYSKYFKLLDKKKFLKNEKNNYNILIRYLTRKYSNDKEKADIPVTRRINPNVKDKINYQNYSDLVVSKFNNTDTTIKVDLPLSLSEKKVMSETEIEKLLKVCESVSKILNIKNYDIEWTIDEKGNIYILQCRPITTKFEVGKMEQNENKKFGIGLVNGEVIGKVIRIIDENTAKKFEQGSILVTKRLSGYSLMAANKAIGCIIESKSPLSHSAIIARELGIPVVGNVDINSICNNERYYINGKTGEYKIVKNSNINKNETRLNNKEISLSQKLKNNLLKVIESFDQDIV